MELDKCNNNVEEYKGIFDFELVGIVPENLSKVPYIKVKENDKGKFLYSIDGFYKIKNNKSNLRMIKEYRANEDKEAIKKAEKEGLIKGILLEQIIGESIECTWTKKISGKELIEIVQKLKNQRFLQPLIS